MSPRTRIALGIGLGAAVLALFVLARDGEAPEGPEAGARDDVLGRPAPPGPPPAPAPAPEVAEAAADAGPADPSWGTVEVRQPESAEERERVSIAVGGGGQAAEDGARQRTTGWRLGQTRRILGYMRDRLPRLEEAIAEAEQEGDEESARIARLRVQRSRERIAQLEAHAVDLEREATADGTLADAELTGPGRVGVGSRVPTEEQPE